MKPRYRYNWKTKTWNEVFKVDFSTVCITGFINPKTGERIIWTGPAAKAFKAL